MGTCWLSKILKWNCGEMGPEQQSEVGWVEIVFVVVGAADHGIGSVLFDPDPI